jgi:hypothetical protein
VFGEVNDKLAFFKSRGRRRVTLRFQINFDGLLTA